MFFFWGGPFFFVGGHRENMKIVEEHSKNMKGYIVRGMSLEV